MWSMMKETQKICITLKAAAGKEGINSFLLNFKLPVHKNETLVKTKYEQVADLLKGKSAFTPGGQWCTLGFILLGSHAILRAQKEQLNIEAKRNADQR